MILDTNALSATAEGVPAILRALSRADELLLPAIVLGEYRYGIAQSRHRVRYTRWLDSLIGDCTVLEGRRELHTTMRISLRSFGILESPFQRMTFGLLHSTVSTRFHS